jgi:SPP1 gp7 family putative phage head morphogenesis protein
MDETPFPGIVGTMPAKLPGDVNFSRVPVDPDEPGFPQDETVVPGTATIAPLAPVGKAETAGMTTNTGIEGVDLVDDDDELVKGELVAFRKFAAARRKRGTWRNFEFEHVDKTAAHRLNMDGFVAFRKDSGELIAAGLAVQAADTNRVLMLQRTLDLADPASGTWEFPGGHIEPGENAQEAAVREWQEETGQQLPDGRITGMWDGSNGVYAGFVYQIASEALIDLGARDVVINPDDPDGDVFESIAWWDPPALQGVPVIRTELAADAADVIAALSTEPSPDGPLEVDVDPKEEAVTKSWRDSPNLVPQHAFDLRIVDHYQPHIQDALTDWVNGLPVASIAASTSVAKADAADASITVTDANIIATVRAQLATGANDSGSDTLDTLIRNVLLDGYTSGMFGAGQQVPNSTLAGTIGQFVTSTDWSAWAPGDTAAAAQAADGGLSSLLSQTGVTIKSIVSTSLDQAGNIIAAGLERGDSVDTIGRALRDVVASPSRAEMIAHTETARAQSAATADVYQANGVSQWDLLLADDACDDCVAVSEAGPYDASDTDDAPPVHPRCRCAMTPHTD